MNKYFGGENVKHEYTTMQNYKHIHPIRPFYTLLGAILVFQQLHKAQENMDL